MVSASRASTTTPSMIPDVTSEMKKSTMNSKHICSNSSGFGLVGLNECVYHDDIDN